MTRNEYEEKTFEKYEETTKWLLDLLNRMPDNALIQLYHIFLRGGMHLSIYCLDHL